MLVALPRLPYPRRADHLAPRAAQAPGGEPGGVCRTASKQKQPSGTGAGARPPRFVSVGERRSRRGSQMGVRWEHGRLCARTLHAALRAMGLDPAQRTYVNAYADSDPPAVEDAVARLRLLADTGAQIVALGRAAHRALERAGVPHRRLIHPAARGAIRARLAIANGRLAARDPGKGTPPRKRAHARRPLSKAPREAGRNAGITTTPHVDISPASQQARDGEP